MHPNAALVLQFYEARARDDRAAIREILGEGVAWHDPYPPPHGGDLRGIAAVFRDILDRAGKLTGASTQLAPVDVLAEDARAAIVEWSATYKGRTLHGRELAQTSPQPLHRGDTPLDELDPELAGGIPRELHGLLRRWIAMAAERDDPMRLGDHLL